MPVALPMPTAGTLTGRTLSSRLCLPQHATIVSGAVAERIKLGSLPHFATIFVADQLSRYRYVEVGRRLARCCRLPVICRLHPRSRCGRLGRVGGNHPSGEPAREITPTMALKPMPGTGMPLPLWAFSCSGLDGSVSMAARSFPPTRWAYRWFS